MSGKRYGVVRYTGYGCLTWILLSTIYAWPLAAFHGPAAAVTEAVWLVFAIPFTVVVSRRQHRKYLTRHPKTPALHRPPGEVRQRAPLPAGVRQAVWVRDGGCCRRCGISDAQFMDRTGEHLQYDHIIPFSRNGADTVANIQLLCGPCNRAKGATWA